MTTVPKVDSNATGLRYQEETSFKVPNTSNDWIALEPNDYNDFGGELTLLARNPINDSRQRKKGVIVDLDASGGFTSDFTQDNMQDLLQGFMFADFREKGTELVTAVDVDGGNPDEYQVASTADFLVGSLIQGQNFEETPNNAVNIVTAIVGDTSVEVVDGVLVDEASPPATARIVVVGHEFGTAEVDVVVSGTLPVLSNVAVVAATSILTYTANASNGDTITIGSQVYTLETALTDSADNVLIGATADDTVNNLVAAISASEADEGTLFGTGTVANTDVTAANSGGDTMTVTAIIHGLIGNSIGTSDSGSGNGTWTGANLASGSGTSFLSLGVIPGEWVFVGGDIPATDFTTAANNGPKRVRSITNTALEFDKSDNTMVVETGTGITLRVFTGRVLKNEQAALIKRRTYQLERTLGAPDDALPTEIQAEYLEGAVPSELVVNIPQANKLTAGLAFVAGDNSQIDGPTALKSGDRPAIVDTDAFNTSSDGSRFKIGVHSDTNEAPDALFAFATEMTLTINNNLTPNKALFNLGAFDVTAGTFQVSAQLTAYFASVAAVQSVRNNDNVTVDFFLYKNNAGFILDLPLVALGDGRLNVEQDRAITLPLSMDAATASQLDTNLDHTLLWTFFDYLPAAADV